MARKPSRLAAQSAMEYLMTYGWAILIIAVVLAALFELGVFNGSNLTPQACITQAGFVCMNPVYTANGIGITFGQTTDSEYFDSFIFIAAEGEPLSGIGIPQNFTNPSNGLFIGNLISGQTVGADFNASKFAYGQIPANAPIDTPFAGYVWLGYCLSPCSAPTAYSKVATIAAREAGTGSASFGGYFGGGSGSSSPPPAQQFSFTVSVNPAGNTVTAGQSTNTVVTISTSIANNANVVTLSNPVAPTVTETFNPMSCTPDPTCTSALSISTTSSTQPGNYPITVTGTNALTGATSNAVYTLTVISPYVNITLNPASTISGMFQQNITFNPSTYSTYESGDLGNIRFCTDSTCSSGYLDSWLEGCPETACSQSSSHAIFWIKLNGEKLGENIYMVFGPTSGTGSEFDGSIAGEAPQISQTYAQYDNGASVFTTYKNAGSASPVISLNVSAPATFPFISDALTSWDTAEEDLPYTPLGTISSSNLYWDTSIRQAPTNCYFFLYSYSGSYTDGNGVSYTCTDPVVETLIITASGAEGQLDYSSGLSTLSGTSTPGGTLGGHGQTYYYWVRSRVYPPSGVMPQLTFGSIS